MSKGENKTPYDLEERTYLFAGQVRSLVKLIPPTLANLEDSKQLLRASGSVGANYIEANEALGSKDFLMKIKIAKREAKECRFFLKLIDTELDVAVTGKKTDLIREAQELEKILGAIFRKNA